MARHRASQPRGVLEQWARRVLPVVMLALATGVLWAAALSAGVRCWRSPDGVTVTRCT